jgi:hypothetical protein
MTPESQAKYESARLAGFWRTCSSAMPEFGEEVIIWSPESGLSFARLEWEQGSAPEHWQVVGGRWELSEVTHWMPTPKPPLK